MLFSSLTFLLFFLPVVMTGYACLKGAWRIRFLLAASLLFYGWADPRYLILMGFEILFSWFLANHMDKAEGKKRKLLFVTGCIVIVGFLVIFKYTDFLISTFNQIFFLHLPLANLVLPVGISFYTFQILSYLADIYQKKQKPEASLAVYACYIAMFCQLIAGPIVRYSTIAPQITKPQISWQNSANGLNRFLCGLCKKVLIANGLFGFCQTWLLAESPSMLYAWVYAICNVLFIYYDFSGYSDMAIGLGKMLGYTFPENFLYPLTAGSITDFWRRWHISLTTWFKDYVYIPLGGNRKGKARWLLNMLVIWLLTGLWHGAAWNFVIWGLYFYCFLALEKMVPAILKIPGWIRHLAVWLIVMIGFVIFSSDSSWLLKETLLEMAGQNVPFMTAYGNYQILSVLPLMLYAFLGMGNWIHKFYEKLLQKPVFASLQPAFNLVFLVLCLAWLVGGSFNPFLYFRF